jgi:hypothetical protein
MPAIPISCRPAGSLVALDSRIYGPTRTLEREIERLHANIGQLVVEREFLAKRSRKMSAPGRRELVERGHAKLSTRRQYELARDSAIRPLSAAGGQ